MISHGETGFHAASGLPILSIVLSVNGCIAGMREVLRWSLGYGFAVTACQLLSGIRVAPLEIQWMAASSLSLLAHLGVGVVLGFMVTANQDSTRLIGWILSILSLLLNAVAYRYFAVLGVLPGADAFYYVDQLNHLMPSLIANFPLAYVGPAVLISCLCLYLGIDTSPAGIGTRPSAQAAWYGVSCLMIVLAGVTGQAVVAELPTGSREIARNPLFNLLESVTRGSGAGEALDAVPDERFRLFQKYLGHAVPFGSLDPEQPLCSESQSSSGLHRPRNVILLVVESLGRAQFEQRAGDQWMLPNLRQIAAQNLYFDKVIAAGSKSVQALPALFSGLPPQTSGHILWMYPLPPMQSFVQVLNDSGYATGYLHGSDLLFENQRDYLLLAGFAKIREPGPEMRHDYLGWGYDDGVMFEELRQWIEARSDARYFVTLATLSTHDPYIVPDSWNAMPNDVGQMIGETARRRSMIEAFRFFDAKIGEFYAWYLDNEYAKGTLLVIVGDHPAFAGSASPLGSIEDRYEIPLIIAGDGLRKGVVSVPGAHHDLPSTLGGLLGMDRLPCDQGLDLLAPDNRKDAARMLYAVDGNFRSVDFWDGERHAILDRSSLEITEVTGGTESLLKRVESFMTVLFPVNDYLLNKPAYAAGVDALNSRAEFAAPPIQSDPNGPILVSHRGNTGISPAPNENSKAAIRAAIDAGFEWVEIDLQISSDGIPILYHDETVSIGGQAVPIWNFTHDELLDNACCGGLATLADVLEEFGREIGFLIELKPQSHISRQLALVREVALLVEQHSAATGIIIDSFQLTSLRSMEQQCGCETGFDADPSQPIREADMRILSDLGMEWLYLDRRQASVETIAAAHAIGLKVMVYTVNDPLALDKWTQEWPDGIITDSSELRAAVISRFREGNH